VGVLSKKKKQRALRRSRIITALLAVVALLLAYVSPSNLIFTLVSYVWAGIGCTFSIVILLSLFWKRYHGRAVLATIIVGLVFTIFWISGGFEQHYRVTGDNLQFLVEQQVLTEADQQLFQPLMEKKYVSQSAFEEALQQQFAGEAGQEIRLQENLPRMVTTFTQKGIPARLMTFLVALATAVLSTFILPRKIAN
jgi:hypothetical protein